MSMLMLSVEYRGLSTGPNYKYVQRNLALELVRVTEAAALAAGRWLGKVYVKLALRSNRDVCHRPALASVWDTVQIMAFSC